MVQGTITAESKVRAILAALKHALDIVRVSDSIFILCY